MKIAAGLYLEFEHVESEVCWCDPLVEMDDDGRMILIHKEVVWN